MKQVFWLYLLTASIIFFGCKKDNNSTNSTATSTWTFDGKTYKVTGAYVDDNLNILFANDDPGIAGGGNYVKIIFGAVTRPSVSSTLTVLSQQSNPSNCQVQVGNLYDPVRIIGYMSTGKAGDKVVLTVLSSGKLSASFSNITVSDYQSPATIKTVSGTIVEQ